MKDILSDAAKTTVENNDLQVLLNNQIEKKNKKLKILIIGTSEEECLKVSSLLRSRKFQTIISLVDRAGSVVLDDVSADVHIVCLPENFHALRHTDDYSFPVSAKPLLYTTEDTSDKTRLWAFRHGANDLLVFPFHATELQITIEHLFAGDRRRFEKFLTEKFILIFLAALMKENVSVIEPVLDPSMPYGHFYPAVARFFGKTSFDSIILEKLAQEGVLARQVANRIRICPLCGDTAINYRDVCPHCQSLAIVETEVIHHFACGHMGPIDSFRSGAELVCPKCANTLRHIGLDYEKPTQYFFCRDCDALFAEPKIEAQCFRCAFVTEPDKLIAKEIFRYEATANAQQALNEQRISGLNLSSLLRNSQSGLYSKQYFTNEATREIFRSQRTGNHFCMMLIRVDDFDHIRTEHDAMAAEFVRTIFTCISKNLRILDVTCVWDTDLLAVLLPETVKVGGEVVAQRMNDHVRGLEHLYSTHEPGISISLVEWNEKHKKYDDIFQEMLRDLNE